MAWEVIDVFSDLYFTFWVAFPNTLIGICSLLGSLNGAGIIYLEYKNPRETLKSYSALWRGALAILSEDTILSFAWIAVGGDLVDGSGIVDWLSFADSAAHSL